MLAGQGGIGKSTAMKHLALGWADGTLKELKQFNFMFHIALKDVRGNETIEEIIIKQHKGLKSRKVSPAEIKNIIESYDNIKVMLLFDGHDEYTLGTNADIDNAITKDILADCWIIVTSRETKQLIRLKEYMNAEAEILGFDKEGVREYMIKCLGSQEKQKELIIIAKKSRIITSPILDSDSESDDDENSDVKSETISDTSDYDNALFDDFYDFGILCIPILLHMICVLFMRKVSLPRTRTGIISAIVERCPDWDEIRKTGQKKVKTIEDAFKRFSEFILGKLLNDDNNQIFNKVL